MARLSEYFSDVASKRLTLVETDQSVSHQHEFNGVASLKNLFGESRVIKMANFIFLGENEEEFLVSKGNLTWYDARENHPTRSEFRLYFTATEVMDKASSGDLLIMAKRPGGDILVLVIQEGATIEYQIKWLFGIDGNRGFEIEHIEGHRNRNIGFAESLILETLGIEPELGDQTWLDTIIEAFGTEFPKTRDFSNFARSTLPEISSLDSPDDALVLWLNHEEMLFRTLENHLVQQKLENGFRDVDEFISYSLRIQNRRKSRMGYALEHHLEQIFIDYSITYSREKVTENKSRPDFIFPGIDQYRDPEFDPSRLIMLGAKSTCKDRWRQILAEADRIPEKHLITLEAGISSRQTDEMQSRNLQLVIPGSLHSSYSELQQEWLFTLELFIKFVQENQ